MKKFFKTTLAFVATVSLLSLGGCQKASKEDINPTYDGEAVKTQFSISIPGALKTRMTAGDAQEDETFSGMTNIKLYPFPQAVTAGTEQVTTAPIELADIAALNYHGTGTEFNSKVYHDVAVPIGTTNFLFYGKKTSTTDGELKATFAANGENANNTSFAQVNISDYTVATVNGDTEAASLLTALNNVATEIENQRAAAAAASEAIEQTITDIQTLYESNKAGSANSVDSMLGDLSETLGASSNDRMAAIKTVVDASKTTVDGLTFPRNINLPDGAVGVACTSHAFAFAAQNNSGMGTPELNTYVKPAELYYYVNTPIHVSNGTHEDEYDDQAAWTNVVALYDDGTKVANTTRGVVLDNKIQYAVAQLVTGVKITAGTLKANDGTAEPTKVDLTSTSFAVTGILIGAQGDVDWKFQPTAAGTHVVYDPTWAGTTPATSSDPAAKNYTLVLETPGVPNPAADVAAGTNDEVVRVAIEFENGSEEFFGVNDELIPAGSRFYLVAELKVSGATSGSLKKVFQQDYKTIANFTIGVNSLCNAYNTIPDLRTPKMELGLAVDLQWQEGLTFNVELGQL